MNRSDQEPNESELGLDGIPQGDPDFTFIVEIDLDWNDVTAEQRKQLNSYHFPGKSSAGRSRLGTTILAIECEQRGWYQASDEGLDHVRTIGQDWPISGLHLCRSDLWQFEFAPDPNQTELHLDASPKATGDGTAKDAASIMIIEIDVKWNDLSANARKMLKMSGDSNFGDSRHVEKSSSGNVQLRINCNGDWNSAFSVGTKSVHGVSNQWPIARYRVCRTDVWQREQSEGMPADLFGNNLAENPSLVCCYKILQMVGHLHARGYQRLRIFPWGGGMKWVCELAPAELFNTENGACMESKPEYERDGLVAIFSSGDGCRPFRWKRDISRMSVSSLADLFLERFPAIASASRGSDWSYAGWYQEMLMRTDSDVFPVAFFADEHEEICTALSLFPMGDGQIDKMPLPPIYRA
jgi:hypothetical protein